MLLLNPVGYGQVDSGGAGVKEISASELTDWVAGSQKFILIDVREDSEWQAGHAAAALHLKLATVADRIGSVAPDKGARIVLYCLVGARSANAAGTLRKMGYTNVFSLAGGFRSYQRAGLPVRK